MHVIAIPDPSSDAKLSNYKLTSVVSSLVLRSGCASLSKLAVVPAQSNPSIGDVTTSTSAFQQQMMAIIDQPRSFADLDVAFEIAGKKFDELRTETTARGVVVMSASQLPSSSDDRHRATAAAASLQQRGFRIIAVSNKALSEVGYPEGFDVGFSAVRQGLSAFVSFPPERHILHATDLFSVSGKAMSSDTDLAFPDRVQSSWPPTEDTWSDYALVPMDPRGADCCVVPRTCVISAGAHVRALSGETYSVVRTGEYVIASFRSPLVGQTDIYGGFGRCVNASGVCLHSVKVVTRSRLVSVNAAPNHRGTRIVDTWGQEQTFVGAFETSRTFDGYVDESSELSVQSMMPIAGTWTSTTGDAKGSEVMGAYAIQVVSPLAGTSNAIAHIRIDYDTDASHVAVSMTLAAETSPVRSGLCGVPAGEAGEAASPAARVPRMAQTQFTSALQNLSDIAVYAASEGTYCPPASQPYRPLSTDSDGIRRLHTATTIADTDISHITKLLQGSRWLPFGGLKPSLSHLSHEVFEPRSAPSHPDCEATFGDRSVMAKMCNDNAAVGMSAPLFPILRTLTALCRMRCAHPDDVLRSTGAAPQVLRGGSSQSDLGSEGRGTEILSDLVTVGWCDRNICKPGVPALKPLNTAAQTVSEDYFASKYTPLWVLLSRRRTAKYVNALLASEDIFDSNSHENINAIVTPPVGGRYLFSATAKQASCSNHKTNVSLTVRCPLQLEEPFAGRDVNVTMYNNAFPWVSLFGNVRLVESLATPPSVSVYWGVDEAPNHTLEGYEAPEFVNINQDVYFRYQSTTAPMFRPMWPGRWVLHMSVYDGCQVRSRNVVVNAKCWEGCGGQHLHVDSIGTMDLSTTSNVAYVNVAFTGLRSFGDGVAIPRRGLNLTTPFVGYEAMPSTASSWKVFSPFVEQTATARSYPSYYPTSEVSDRFNYFVDEIYPRLSSPTELHNAAQIGDRYEHSHDGLPSSTVKEWTKTTVDTAKPSQCGIRASPTDTLSNREGVSIHPTLPQTDTVAFNDKWYTVKGAELPTGGVTTAHGCDRFPSQVPKSVGVSDVGVDITKVNGASGVVVGPAFHGSDCGHESVRTANVSVYSLRQPVAYDVVVTMNRYQNEGTIAKDGVYHTRAWLEYRSVAAGEAATPKWADTDPVGPEGAEWKAVVGSEVLYTASTAHAAGRIMGPAVVRVRFEFETSKTNSWRMFTGSAVPVVDTTVTPAKVCDDKHITVRAQVTDGCHLYTDHAETSYECHLPPHVELVTPHYEVEFDYDAGSNGEWPSVPISVNYAAEFNTHVVALKSLDHSVATGAANTLTTAENRYTYTVSAFTHMPSYAAGVVRDSNDREISKVIDVPMLHAFSVPDTRCGVTSAPTSFPFPFPPLGPSTAEVFTSTSTGNSPRALLRSAGSDVPTLSGGESTTFTWSVGCGRVSAVNESVDVVVDALNMFDQNVTHLNMTYFVHAATTLIDPEHYVLRVSYASFAYHGQSDTVSSTEMPHDWVFTPLFEISQPIQQHRAHPFEARHVIFPIMSGIKGNLVLRMSLDRVKDNTETAVIGYPNTVSIGGIELRPAYIATADLANSQRHLHSGIVAVKGEGVARFAVSAHNDCGSTVSYLDVEAKCKHDIPTQTWTAHMNNHTAGDRYVAATGSATSTGNGRLVLHPTQRSTLILAVADGVKVAAGKGTVAARLEDSEKRSIVEASTWDTYGPAGTSHPGTGDALTNTDLIDGVHAEMPIYYPRQTDANLHVTFGDGCRSRVDSVPVTVECSPTVFKTPKTFILDSSFVAVDSASLKAQTDYYLYFVDEAHYTAPGAPATAEANISQSAGTWVDITAAPSVDGAQWQWADTGASTYATKYEGTDNTQIKTLLWVDRPTHAMTRFRLTQAGEYKISVKHGFWKYDCAESDAYDVTVTAADKCAKGKTSATFAPQYPEEYIYNVTITIPDYPTADFASSTAAKGKPKMEAALNTILAKYNGRVEWTELFTTGANPQVVVVVAQNMSASSRSDMVNDEIRDNRAFQRTFGYVSTTSMSNIRSVPFTMTISWDGDIAMRSELTRVSAQSYDICGGGKPACPAFASTTARTVDVKVETNWNDVVPSAVTLTYPRIELKFADEEAYCTDAFFTYDSMCRYINGPLELSPVAIAGVHSLGTNPPAIPGTQTSPLTVTYAATDARSFPRAYLYDSAAAHEYIFSPENVRTEYEWWVKAAPERSIYAPHDGSKVTMTHSTNDTARTRVHFYTTTYEIAATGAPATDYWRKAGKIVANELIRHNADVDGAAVRKWSYVQLPKQCLSDSSPDGLRPRAETCFSPDVPGVYTLVYRARGTCDASGTAEWRNATVTINAACPAFSATLPEGLPATMQPYHAADRVSAPTAATTGAELPLAVDLEGTVLKDHVVVEWGATFKPLNSGSSGCDAVWHDGKDINATVAFPCAGEYNVSVVVTDGCTVKHLFHVVTVACDSVGALASALPNSTVVFDVPEGGTLAAFGSMELSPGSDASMDILERADGSLPCASSLTWEWNFQGMHPADDYVIAREFAYDAQALADPSVRVLGLAADYRSAGATTDGDVLTTIMVFAIGISVVVAAGVIVFLVVSKREAAAAAGVLKPSEPLPSKPLPDYS